VKKKELFPFFDMAYQVRSVNTLVSSDVRRLQSDVRVCNPIAHLRVSLLKPVTLHLPLLVRTPVSRTQSRVSAEGRR
jgi:hypothetical protein